MLLDQNWQLWANLESQYSFQTAIALAFVCFFIVHGHLSRWIAAASIFGYIELMLQQNIYQWSDILTTAIVTAPLMLIIQAQSSQAFIAIPSQTKTATKNNKVGQV